VSRRPLDWSPLASGDPVPGDPDRVEQLGRHYQRVASAISDAATKLRRIAEHQDMHSEAVAAFRDTAREVADDISRAHERYDGVGRALSGYAPELREAQSESAAALVQAQHAEDDLVTANRLAHAAQVRIHAAPDGTDTTADQGDHRRALTAADAARDDLAAARRRLRGATETRDAAARRAMSLVAEVKDSGDLNDTWWDNWGAKIVQVIVKVADVVAVVAGVLALLVGWIPIIGQALAAILGTVALLASLVSLLGNLALAATGDGEWSDVAWSALGVLSFGVGRAAIGALRVSALGVRGASRLAAGRLAARSVAVRVAAGLPRSGNPMTAIRSMLGTANPLGRRLARAAAQRSLEQGFFPSASSIGQSVRAMPGEFADNIRTLRHADWGDALRQARQGGRPDVLQFLGEHGAAADLQDIKQIHSAVRDSDEVAPHLRQLRIQYGTFVGAAGYGVYDTFHNAVKLMHPPSAAEQPHLPNAYQPVGAGARP
jgi:Putative T7SS secretion signal domain